MDARAERMGEELASGWQGMIDAKRLLSDCQALVRQLEADLRDEFDQRPELQAALKREHHEATVAKRTRRSAEEWTAERITQAGAAWVLGCVFVRFLEDNALVDRPRLSGTGAGLQRARDEETLYFRQHPERTAREYIEDTFREVAVLPGGGGLFDERHNPLWQLPISGDAARVLLERWREIDPQSGVLVHDFTDAAWGTRFLGDLYQDLSEAARKQYALLQTPEFVEEFILERTLEPAIDEFGLANVSLIDPACGSGHFLLGAFRRLVDHWREQEPGNDVRVHVERALAAVAGVDLNPFAAAIARFRLLVAALRLCEVRALRNAPDFKIRIAVGDSLLHTSRRDRLEVGSAGIRKGLEHVYATEDAEDLRSILGQRYQAVVANPPYITAKDTALNQAYRDRFDSCSGKYALSVPFMELLFELAVPADPLDAPAGFVGQITSNSFMKREFGKRLVETLLRRVDTTLVVDMSGAYVPGHGTPTVILVGRNRSPLAPTIRTVMGISGEPATPADPANGVVWTAILRQVDEPGSQSAYVSVEDVDRTRFAKHPWSVGGGGASDLRETLERASRARLIDVSESIGFQSVTGDDEIFVAPTEVTWRRRGIPSELVRRFGSGEEIRDWLFSGDQHCLFPYGNDFAPRMSPEMLAFLWPWRAVLQGGQYFGKTREERGLEWWEYAILLRAKLRTTKAIAWGEVATHNSFIFARGNALFTATSPVVKLPDTTDEDQHLGLLGILNSSTACFWFKQVCHNKGSTVDQHGARQRTAPFEDFFQFNGTKVGQCPLPDSRPLERALRLNELAAELASTRPGAVAPTHADLNSANDEAQTIRARMVALQEELDWEVYGLYDLIDEALALPEDDVPQLKLGERAFEIALARRVAAGEEHSTWFARHSSKPITEVPKHWPGPYRELVERRIQAIASNRDISLIERPEYKRRWQWEPWEKQQECALREWLLCRLEHTRYWQQPQLTSCARLADEVRSDADFRSVAELYAGRSDVDLTRLVESLVVDEAVPYLAAWIYTEDAMRIRAAWEQTWELQRCEDEIDRLCALPEGDPKRLTPEQARAQKGVEVGKIPVPPKYTSKHFRKTTYWHLRGRLDVPKERFILYPGAERAADSSSVIGWAGWNHLQRAQALAQYLTRMRQEERWGEERLKPLLAGLAELLPWLQQWHNIVDPSLGRPVGDAYADFLGAQLAELGLTAGDLAAWRPPEATRGSRARKVAV